MQGTQVPSDVRYADALGSHLRKYSDGDLVIYSKNVADCLRVHPAYQGAFPEVVANSDQLTDKAERLNALALAVKNREMQKIPERNYARADLVQAVTGNALYTVMMYFKTGDLSVIRNTGHIYNTKPSKAGNVLTGPPECPENLTVVHGHPTTVVVKANKPKRGTGPFWLQMCVGEPTSEESWQDVGHFKSCKSIVVKDLTPGQKYSFRIRTHSDEFGPGPWSPVVGIICL